MIGIIFGIFWSVLGASEGFGCIWYPAGGSLPSVFCKSLSLFVVPYMLFEKNFYFILFLLNILDKSWNWYTNPVLFNFLSYIAFPLLIILLFFIIGTLMGWVVGKIKSKKNFSRL